MRAKFPQMLAIITILLVLGAVLGACAGIQQQFDAGKQVVVDLTGDSNAGPTAVAPISEKEAQTLWQEAQEKGELVVGVSGQAPPFVYYSADGELLGSDVDTMRRLGERLGLEIVFRRLPADEVLAKVRAGEVDAAIGGIAITPERAALVDFSQPYRTVDMAFLLAPGASWQPPADVQALAAHPLGAAQDDEMAAWLLQQVEAGLLQRENIKLYPNMDAAVAALTDGDIDAVVTNAITAGEVAAQTAGQLQLLNKNDKVLLTYKPLRNQSLQHTEWQLQSYADDSGQQMPVLSSAPITATITDAIIEGSAGCNAYAADIQLNETDITVTPPVIPRHECEEEGVMAQENVYLDNLLSASTYTIQGDTLIFRDDAGQVLLVFRARPQVDLANSEWTLQAYGSVSQPQPVPAGLTATLKIDQDGKFSGASGCNSYTGSLNTQADGVHFELGPATLKSCDPVTDNFENLYLQALAHVERVSQQQDKLVLSYNGGLDALVFRAQRQNPIQFSDWELIALGAPKAENAPLPITQLTALFGKEKLSGSAGCNAFETTFSATENQLKIGKITLTNMLCPDEKVTAQEKAYVKKLRNTRGYQLRSLDVMTSTLHTLDYGIAVPPGADELLNVIDHAVAQLTAEQEVIAANEDAGEEGGQPQESAKPRCTDKLKWLEDVTYDDHNMRRPPKIDPGVAFQKVWRVKNVGTCTWNSDYYLDFFEGTREGADMSGQRTYIEREVKPGETYELKLNLRAPLKKGKYQGFWKLYNANMRPFAKLWVGIRVRKPATPFPTPTPTPTPAPQPVLQFSAERTHMQPKQCTTLTWHTENIAQAYLVTNDDDWEGNEVDATGTREVCPKETTTYHLGALLADDSKESKSLTIQISTLAPPQIVSFASNPPETLTLGQSLTLLWDVQGEVQRVELRGGGIPLLSDAPAFGSLTDTPAMTGTMTYTLQATGPGGVSEAGLVIQVVEEAPTPTPAPLADAPGVELIAGWLLTGMSDDAGETQPLPDNAAIILTFDTGGNFNGFAGCNNYAGVFSVLPGQKLVLKQSQLTEMTCDAPEGVMDLERAYLQRLAEVDRYQVDEDGVLQLGTPSGAKLSFVRGTAP